MLNTAVLAVYKNAYTAVDKKPEVLLRSLKGLVGERGFEPPTPWSRNNHGNTISLIRLAWLCVTHPGFTWFSALN
jgi:hypothetical protein